MESGKTDETVDFGFSTVPRGEKRARVREVFNSVAGKYDVMNDLMSLGVHRLWKREFGAALDPRPNRTLLDLAGGTGDITFNWLRHGGGPAILSDINAAMLAVGRNRATANGLLADITFLVTDAEAIPLPDGAVDRVSMAFGLRNCTNKDRVLAEARRVLKPGGKFLCLEFSKLQIAGLERAYDAWSFGALPRIGKMVAGDAESYRYLAESIRMFPDQETLKAMMEAAGLERVSVRNLSGGIAAIHSGWRL
jgi:demethylmenaquinone methyltransferase/2-methoxy-6-polyprenyl-1,4-benzoquinol methylase